MGKVVTSPVKRFPGTVTLSDPLSYPQVFAIEDAIKAVREMGEDADARRIGYAWLPGIVACVEEWQLEGLSNHVTADTFPATPTVSAAKLLAWLIGEVTELYKEDANPND